MPVPAVRIFSIPAAKRHLAYAGRHAAICHGVAGIEYFFHLHCPFPTYRIEYRRTFRRRIILADGIFIPGRSHVPGIPPAYRYSASTPLFHYIRRSGSQRCSFLLQPYALHGAVYIYSFGSTFPASAQTSTEQASVHRLISQLYCNGKQIFQIDKNRSCRYLLHLA